jgi:hypothetical protein
MSDRYIMFPSFTRNGALIIDGANYVGVRTPIQHLTSREGRFMRGLCFRNRGSQTVLQRPEALQISRGQSNCNYLASFHFSPRRRLEGSCQQDPPHRSSLTATAAAENGPILQKGKFQMIRLILIYCILSQYTKLLCHMKSYKIQLS